MKLDRVTLTGADDSVNPGQLAELSEMFPNVEWGILFSKRNLGSPRFPTLDWVRRLAEVAIQNPKMQLSAHLCGRWVRDLVFSGNFTWMGDLGSDNFVFRRIQLNFHGDAHPPGPAWLPRMGVDGRQMILQHDGMNDGLYKISQIYHPRVDVVPLYDLSGGRGVLPKEWPKAMPGVYQGYSGGLGPDNIGVQLSRISEAVGGETIWIDMETKIRSEDNKRFDLEKCYQVLLAVKTYLEKNP
jgi:hypothetical protein